MTGKEKCAKLKKIRAALASKLGIDLHQVECTFEGECTGTCPKCKQEEDALNSAILHKGAAAAGAVMLATSMTACVPFGGLNNPLNGGSDLSGDVAYDPSLDGGDDVEVLSGEVDERMVEDETDAQSRDANGKTCTDVDDLTGYVA